MDQKKSGATKSFTREGVLDAGKVGTGDSYLSAFGVILGGTPLQLGILATLPPLLGSVTQMVAVWILEKVPRRKDLIVQFIRLQAMLWIPIAALPFLLGPGWEAVAALILLVVAYQMTIGLILPMWSSWVGDVIPAETRGSFFALRNKAMSVSTFAGLMITAGILQWTAAWNAAVLGFAVAFICAAYMRFRSSRELLALPDIPYKVAEEEKFSFLQFLGRGSKSNFVQFVFFVAAMNFATFLAAPYFAPYMLRDLEFSYPQYAGLLGTSIVAQFVVLAGWGRLSDQFGNRTILAVCGWQVAVNPLFWLVSSNYWFLVLVQIYSGVFWSGFNLAAANFIYDVATPAKRARCVAYYSIVNGFGIFLGSLTGGALVSYAGAQLPFQHGFWAVGSPYVTLFLLSGMARLSVVLGLLGRFNEVRPVEKLSRRELFRKMVSRNKG